MSLSQFPTEKTCSREYKGTDMPLHLFPGGKHEWFLGGPGLAGVLAKPSEFSIEKFLGEYDASRNSNKDKSVILS